MNPTYVHGGSTKGIHIDPVYNVTGAKAPRIVNCPDGAVMVMRPGQMVSYSEPVVSYRGPIGSNDALAVLCGGARGAWRSG